MRELLQRHLNYPKGALICRSGTCQWTNQCANHITSSPDRRKEGPRPNITFTIEGFFCDQQLLTYETGAFYAENDIKD